MKNMEKIVKSGAKSGYHARGYAYVKGGKMYASDGHALRVIPSDLAAGSYELVSGRAILHELDNAGPDHLRVIPAYQERADFEVSGGKALTVPVKLVCKLASVGVMVNYKLLELVIPGTTSHVEVAHGDATQPVVIREGETLMVVMPFRGDK